MKFVHVINPYKCPIDNPSYLYYAQPITFKSMLISKKYSENHTKNLKVKLCNINYPEDDGIVPKNFKKLPYLENSTQKLYNTNKKLPILQEIFNKTLKNTMSDYIIFTNSDISLKPYFYKKIYLIIKYENRKSFTINRRDNIPKFINKNGNKIRLTNNNMNVFNKFKGERHPGNDCFVIHRSILKQINLGELFIGYPPWGFTLVSILRKLDPTFKIYKNLFLTYHLGKDKQWKQNNNELHIKNIENSKKVKKKYLI